MSITHHPADATLMAYAAGTLSEPFAVLVASHIELCARCQTAYRDLNALGGALIAASPAAALESAALERILRRLDEPVQPSVRLAALPLPLPGEMQDLPRPLARLIGGGLDAIQWRNVIPGADDFRIMFPQRDGVHSLRFLRADPGRELPEHSHVGTELTFVLRGALRDGGKVFGRGDITDMDDEGTHNPIVDGAEPCFCVIANEAPPRFVDPKMQALQEQIGI